MYRIKTTTRAGVEFLSPFVFTAEQVVSESVEMLKHLERRDWLCSPIC